MSAILEPLGYAPLTPDETDQALDLIAIKPRSTAELVRRLSSTPAAIRAALEPLIQTGHLIRPPGGDWRPGERFGSSPGPRPAPSPRLPELETPPPEAQPPTLQARVLALVAAEPGITQAEAGRRLSNQASVSRICKYLESIGRVRRERTLGSAALRLFPVAAPEPVPPAVGSNSHQTEDPPATPANPEKSNDHQIEGEGGDCEGDGLALSGWAAQLQDQIDQAARLRAEIAAAWATLGRPAGPDLPAAILLALESARRGLPLADAGETAGLRARAEELEKQRDAALERETGYAQKLARLEHVIPGLPGEDPEERINALVEERDAALAAEARLSVELSALEDAPPPALAPRWVETAPGSWDLQALRPVVVAEIEQEAGGWSWSVPDADPDAEPIESGRTRSLERAKRAAAEAAAEGADRG